MCNTNWVNVPAVNTRQQRKVMYGAPQHCPTCGLTCSQPCLPPMPLRCVTRSPVPLLAAPRASLAFRSVAAY